MLIVNSLTVNELCIASDLLEFHVRCYTWLILISEAVKLNQLSQRETIEPKTNLKLYMVTSVLAPTTTYHYL